MKFAFVFPGQGSQSVGMMAPFEGIAVVRDTFAEASDALHQDLWALVAAGPAEVLNQTTQTQPAMLAAGVAVYRYWRALGGPEPAAMAGHSLGEYSALVAAGALSLADAIPLVRLRAQAMQDAVTEGVGAMAAVLGLSDEDVRLLCAEAAQGDVLEAVNFNSPGQVVIAGHRAAVERGMTLAKAKGAKRALLLPVSVPSHCSLMGPAAERLAEHLRGIPLASPAVAVIQNADVMAHTDPASIKDALVRQLYSPVRWVETITKLAGDGVSAVAECGPGKVLSGLTKRIVPELGNHALVDPASCESTLNALKT